MKRTGEIVLGIIGVILSGFFVLAGIGLVFLQSNDSVQAELQRTLEESGTSSADIQIFFESVASGGWILTITALIAVILGIAAIVLVKNNKKPKLAGVLFILSTLFIVIPTVGIGFLPAILFLIAGILSFVRKSKDTFQTY